MSTTIEQRQHPDLGMMLIPGCVCGALQDRHPTGVPDHSKPNLLIFLRVLRGFV
jgi:hypothetical protein